MLFVLPMCGVLFCFQRNAEIVELCIDRTKVYPVSSWRNCHFANAAASWNFLMFQVDVVSGGKATEGES